MVFSRAVVPEWGSVSPSVRCSPFSPFLPNLAANTKGGFATWHVRSTSQRGRCLKFFCAALQLGEQAVHTKGRHRNQSVCHFGCKSQGVSACFAAVPHHFWLENHCSGAKRIGWPLCKAVQQRRSWPLLDKHYQDPDTFSRFIFPAY